MWREGKEDEEDREEIREQLNSTLRLKSIAQYATHIAFSTSEFGQNPPEFQLRCLI